MDTTRGWTQYVSALAQDAHRLGAAAAFQAGSARAECRKAAQARRDQEAAAAAEAEAVRAAAVQAQRAQELADQEEAKRQQVLPAFAWCILEGRS